MRAYLLSFFCFILISGCIPSSLPSAQPMQSVALADGDTYAITAAPVHKTLEENPLEMLAYNEQIPGPLLKVKQGSTITIPFTNNLNEPTTIHWHGLRHANRDDGVPDVTQVAVRPGETYTYTLSFPDPGFYWYHPHVREDLQQEKGLYGGILVEPTSYEATPVSREIPIILDDVLLNDQGTFFPFPKDATNFALMGRFGNRYLVNGERQPHYTFQQGDLVRFFFLDAANVRPFNISIEHTPLKIVASDLGPYAQEYFGTSIIISPGERYITEAFFLESATYRLLHTTPQQQTVLAVFDIQAVPDFPPTQIAPVLHEYPVTQQDIVRLAPLFDAPVDITYHLNIDMRGMQMDPMMHSDSGNIEWEDTMFMMNQMHTNTMLEWFISDEKSGLRNMKLHQTVPLGSIKRIRLINDPGSEHPMQHPIHLHGQRFLVLSINGEKNQHLVWKDTVLVPKNAVVELLVEFTNPGDWMLHCHIAEHAFSGMMTMITVEEEKEI